MSVRKRKTAAPEDRLYAAVAAYLRRNGWAPAVIGGVRVQQPIGVGKYRFEFVVSFSGMRKEPKAKGVVKS